MKLSPSQLPVLESLSRSLPDNPVLILWANRGMGRSSILREFQSRHGGVLVGMPEYLDVLRERDPAALEESLLDLVSTAWQEHEGAILDDVHLLERVVGSCNFQYQRTGLIDAVYSTLQRRALLEGKWILFGTASGIDALHYTAYKTGFEKFSVEDYESIAAQYLSGRDTVLDFPKIHRFAPRLNAHQLRAACEDLSVDTALDTNRFVEYLRERRMASNVNLDEVQAVDLTVLKGMDDVLESLEANLVLPLQNDDLATELQLKAKRGVLLAGPPGTGKTTIGRALAHRLKGKFFQIDGTFIAGSQNFYSQVNRIFEMAKQNAPAVIFVDDGDVIFEDDRSGGFYRYLLTMLDGIENESRTQVCVMMTAMNVGSLPAALVRSGRVELWLETRLPDLQARTEILRDFAAKLPAQFSKLEVERVASVTEGLTGADMKRLVDDGKLLYAYDLANGRELRPVTDYFVDAVTTVRSNRERYEAAAAQAKPMQPRNRYMPDYSDYSEDDE